MLIDPNSYLHDTKFGWLTQELEIIEDSFIDYLNSGIELVKSKNDILEQNRQNSIQDLDNSDNSWESYIYYKRKLSNYYLERSFVYSGVSYLYSQLETKLNEIKGFSFDYFSDEYKRKFESSDDYNSVGNSDLESLVKSIKSFCKFSFEGEIDKNWTILCDFRDVRNLIVHENGKISEKFLTKKVIDRTKRFGLKIHNSDEIIFSGEYLITIVKKIRIFLIQLMELIWRNKK